MAFYCLLHTNQTPKSCETLLYPKTLFSRIPLCFVSFSCLILPPRICYHPEEPFQLLQSNLKIKVIGRRQSLCHTPIQSEISVLAEKQSP